MRNYLNPKGEVYQDDSEEEIQLLMAANDTDASDSVSDQMSDSDSDDSQAEVDHDIDEESSDDDEAVEQEGATGADTESRTRVIEEYDETEEEDEVLRAIIAEIKKPRQKPPDIEVDGVVDLSFHPCENLLAVATTTGDVLLYRCANESNQLVSTMEVHTKGCRTVEFTKDGKQFLSTSRDKSIMLTDTETEKLKRFWDAAHTEPVYSMKVLDQNMFATGDDEGTVKLWDIRQRDQIFALKEVEDYISCLEYALDKYLMATSGDGYLTTYSIAGKKMYAQSEPYEEELTSIGVFRNESKLIVSTSKGNFYAFNMQQFGYHCDAFSCPKSPPITSMIPITERIAVTAGDEGILRAMHMVPGRVIGIVGQHSLGVEAMDINWDGELIASSSNYSDIRFWNVKYFEDFDDIKYNEKPNVRRALRHNLPSSGYSNQRDFFADLA